MRVLALDLSKRSAGWAIWGEDDTKEASGWWSLGSEYTSSGRAFGNLHQKLSDLNSLRKIEAIFYEEPLDPRFLSGMTNKDTLAVLAGLAAHAESWGDAMSCRIVRAVNQVTWRRHFLGPVGRPKDENGKRIAIDWKRLAMEKCAAHGLKPAKHDQAEALGILDYSLNTLGMTAPWRRRPGQNAWREDQLI
jgi:hypothetical protein